MPVFTFPAGSRSFITPKDFLDSSLGSRRVFFRHYLIRDLVCGRVSFKYQRKIMQSLSVLIMIRGVSKMIKYLQILI